MTTTTTHPMISEIQKPYGPGNPHPNFGIDPNIMNEFGHTHYPKYIKVGDVAVVAKDEKHEKALLNEAKKGDDWGGKK